MYMHVTLVTTGTCIPHHMCCSLQERLPSTLRALMISDVVVGGCTRVVSVMAFSKTGKEPMPQCGSHTYTGKEPTPQCGSHTYTGKEPMPQCGSHTYTGKEPMPQCGSHTYTVANYGQGKNVLCVLSAQRLLQGIHMTVTGSFTS